MFSDVLYNFQEISIPKFMKKRIREAAFFNKIPIKNGVSNMKFITIIACHTDRLTKLKTLHNNIKHLSFPDNKIVVINSSDTLHSGQARKMVAELLPDVEYYELPNNSALDIGKCMFYLQQYYRSLHDYIVFTNDSYYLTGPVYHFYHFMSRSNCQLYGYNDSFQTDKYHYQSYLYGVRTDALHILIKHYHNMIPRLAGYMDVVNNIELKLCDIFPSKDCFLRIAKIPSHRGRNIFFDSDQLYTKLRSAGVLPIIKLKRSVNPNTPQPHIPHSGIKVAGLSITSYSRSGATIPNINGHTTYY